MIKTKKLNVYLNCFILEAYTKIPISQQKSSGMTHFLQGKYTRAAMSLNRYEWLMRRKIFHGNNTVRDYFLEDRFARMRWFLTEFEKNALKYYQHTEFVVIDETLRNFYALHSCNFKVHERQT